MISQDIPVRSCWGSTQHSEFPLHKRKREMAAVAILAVTVTDEDERLNLTVGRHDLRIGHSWSSPSVAIISLPSPLRPS